MGDDVTVRRGLCVGVPRRYGYAYQAAAEPHGPPPPLGSCEHLAAQCLNLIDDLRKGVPPPRRHRGSVPEAMKEANAMKPALFSAFFGGEPDARVQKICVEVHTRTHMNRPTSSHSSESDYCYYQRDYDCPCYLYCSSIILSSFSG